MFSKITFQKGVNLVIIWGFLHFLSGKKNLETLFVLYNKGICLRIASLLESVSGEMKYFHFGVWSIQPELKLVVGVISLQSFWQK